MSAIQIKFKDDLYAWGIILLAISLVLFCLPSVVPYALPDKMAQFAIHYIIAVIYFFIVLFSGRLKKGKEGIHLLMIFLILFLISAYALNRNMSVFEKSVPWFTVTLVISCVNILLIGYFGTMPLWLRYVSGFMLGVTMVVFAYLALYLLPMYAIGGIAFFVLGISLHTFVPLLFCIYCLVLFRKISIYPGRHKQAFRAGIAVAVSFCIAFIIYWCVLIAGINREYRRSSVKGDGELPDWIRTAQQLPDNWAAKKALKTELVYSIADLSGNNWFWRMPQMNFDEEKKHDPLIMMASLFSGKINIPVDKRIKILEAMFDSRHQAQERLWSGSDLITDHVDTDVTIWPALRIAYTELNITVTNLKDQSSWERQQEAIYTFHLPEGGVVTSLSLWIAGKEAKGILTTKAKADSAYKTIVGVERHDPSVVHWQEGNTVSVRVFPVIGGESRMFKIGVTAPLALRGNKSGYEALYFDGPSAGTATEEVSVTFKQPPGTLAIPPSFDKGGNGLFTRSGSYRADWGLVFDASTIAENRFSFDGRSYSITPVEKQRVPVTLSTIYLDVNAAWSKEECNRVYDLVKNKRVIIASSSDELQQVTAENKDRLFNQLRKQHFSLFPFYKVQDAAASLVIGKTDPASPTINDLKGSPFLGNLQKYFSHSGAIRFYNIGEGLSPYLKTLKEFRALRCEQGDTKALNTLLAGTSFSDAVENDQQVAIENAGITIVQKTDSLPSTAPDHIMRMFAYNHILKKSGTGLLSGAVVDDDLVAEADKAYVVSPVSSLVVLETQSDYDRFDIKSSKNSLQNASSKSKGAVPEPHEWALMAIVLLSMLYARYGFPFNKLSRK